MRNPLYESIRRICRENGFNVSMTYSDKRKNHRRVKFVGRFVGDKSQAMHTIGRICRAHDVKWIEQHLSFRTSAAVDRMALELIIPLQETQT